MLCTQYIESNTQCSNAVCTDLAYGSFTQQAPRPGARRDVRCRPRARGRPRSPPRARSVQSTCKVQRKSMSVNILARGQNALRRCAAPRMHGTCASSPCCAVPVTTRPSPRTHGRESSVGKGATPTMQDVRITNRISGIGQHARPHCAMDKTSIPGEHTSGHLPQLLRYVPQLHIATHNGASRLRHEGGAGRPCPRR